MCVCVCVCVVAVSINQADRSVGARIESAVKYYDLQPICFVVLCTNEVCSAKQNHKTYLMCLDLGVDLINSAFFIEIAKKKQRKKFNTKKKKQYFFFFFFLAFIRKKAGYWLVVGIKSIG